MSNVSAATVHSNASRAVCPVVSYHCQLMDIIPLNADTFQIELQSPAGTMLDYYAGQYLQLELDVNSDGQLQSLSYSIANSFDVGEPRRLQLFIQNSSEMADKILHCLFQLKESKVGVKATLPMGQAFLQTDLSLTHIFIAAGSGISQVNCLAEELLRQRPNADVNIYWSNRNIGDFFLFDEFQDRLNQHSRLNFTPILESADADWPGRSGYIYQVIEKDFQHLNNTPIYLCGSPKMVYGTIDKLKAIGLKEENCYSDVFEYAQRN